MKKCRKIFYIAFSYKCTISLNSLIRHWLLLTTCNWFETLRSTYSFRPKKKYIERAEDTDDFEEDVDTEDESDEIVQESTSSSDLSSDEDVASNAEPETDSQAGEEDELYDEDQEKDLLNVTLSCESRIFCIWLVKHKKEKTADMPANQRTLFKKIHRVFRN